MDLFTPEQTEKEIKKLRKQLKCQACEIDELRTTLFGYTTTTTTTTTTSTTTTTTLP